MTLDFENPPKQVLVGLYPKEHPIDNNQACQLRHHVGGKMLQLDPILAEEATKEI